MNEQVSPGLGMAEEVSGLLAASEGFVRDLLGFKTQFDVFRLMKRVTEAFGARYFMVLNMPPAISLSLSSSSIITNWPAELMSDYDQANLISTSPIFNRLRNASTPVLIDLNIIQREREPRTAEYARQLFERFDMLRGVCFPVHDAAANRGVVALCGSMPSFTFLETALLHTISVHVFNRLAEIRDLDSRVSDTLTEREIDCLNWTAAGKTSVEIAEIMTLSEHTINHYLNRATKKLDTVNRTQAVAKALRLGLIK